MAGKVTDEKKEDTVKEEGEEEVEDPRPMRKILKEFADSDDAKESQGLFAEILEKVGENPDNKKPYQLLADQSDFPRVKTLCQILDSKSKSSEYKKEAKNAIKDKKVLVVGGGPCGLRSAIQLALLGMEVHVVEKRDSFTRNSVLQLWTFLVEDLKQIGFKELLPKFGLGDRLHVSIRRLQLVLMKIALLMGVTVHLGVEFLNLIVPKKKKVGWKAHCFNIDRTEIDRTLKDYEFEALVIGSGRQKEDLGELGFEWVNIKRKLAIAIAANFKNKNSGKDLLVDSLGTQGVMNQLDVFKKIKDEKAADLENVVYLRDDTHYFVMTGKKDNLLERGVLKEDTGKDVILEQSNIDQEKLQEFARDVASFCTEGKVDLEFYEREKGGPDVDIFEFTSRSHAKEAAVVKVGKAKRPLLIVLVGDSLKQPFWPEGVGIAHGFFGAFDSVWAIYEFLGEKLPAAEVLENRKVSYSSMKELSKESMLAVKEYGIDPYKRYGKYRYHKTSKEQEQNTPSTSKGNTKDEKKKGKTKEKTVQFASDKKSKSKKEKKDKEGKGESKGSRFAQFTAFFTGSGKKEKKETKKRKNGETDTDGSVQEKGDGEMLNKSASAEDIREVTSDEPLKRGRFHSLRRSFRKISPKQRKKMKEEKKKEEEAKEVTDKGDGEDDKPTERVKIEHPSSPEKEEHGSPDLNNEDVDVKVEVYDSS